VSCTEHLLQIQFPLFNKSNFFFKTDQNLVNKVSYTEHLLKIQFPLFNKSNIILKTNQNLVNKVSCTEQDEASAYEDIGQGSHHLLFCHASHQEHISLLDELQLHPLRLQHWQDQGVA